MPEKEKISKLYLGSVLLFMLFLPVVCILRDVYFSGQPADPFVALGKWFVFWAIGMRLFTAGARQVTKPAFTAEHIFHLESPEAAVIVRELGFANICFGLTAMISLFQVTWRIPAAFAGGLYFGLAATLHIVKKPAGANEKIALVSDVYITVIAAVYLYHAMEL